MQFRESFDEYVRGTVEKRSDNGQEESKVVVWVRGSFGRSAPPGDKSNTGDDEESADELARPTGLLEEEPGQEDGEDDRCIGYDHFVAKWHESHRFVVRDENEATEERGEGQMDPISSGEDILAPDSRYEKTGQEDDETRDE